MSGAMLLALAVMGVSALLTWQFSRPGSLFYTLDHPNERSLHSQPTPRTGGVAIVLACALGVAVLAAMSGLAADRLAWLGVATLLLAVTSFVDDRLTLKPAHRFIVHLIVAAALCYGGFVVDAVALPGVGWTLPLFVALPVTVLYIVWMVNLYNFMDGMDGFAGGMALVGFGVFAVLGLSVGEWAFAGFNLIVAAAATGFLFFNFPPARIFMGDTGSSCLGLFAAAASIWGAQAGIFPFWVALLVFSPFIVDATVTVLRRALGGERIWEAHRTHYYQRLVRLGWGHRRTVLWEYAVMAACAASALVLSRSSALVQWAMIGSWIGIYVLLAWAVRELEPRGKRRKHNG
jgi:UDP-N-acetylmuramyl pentapeptide phosphotransferase/UDP-N-acetylglucosamine-1-phosphate transferase